jgi:signal transduction histidine kinase
MSIRLRLTLWYTAILASILLVFGVAVYRIFTSSLNSEINRTLDDVARDLIGERSLFFGTQQDQRIVIPRLNTFSLATVYVQVWNLQGDLQARSDNIAGYLVPLDSQTLDKKVSYRHIDDVSVGESPPYLRVLTVPLITRETQQIVGWMQIATSAETVYSARKQLLSILIRGSLIGVVLSSVMGALLAQRALNPINSITQTAVQITRADDLSRRLSHLGPPDEVGRLADAFNEMLERLERIFNAQRRFVADVSHELRTPLTTIRGNADLLRLMGGADPASLNAILSETERMIRMVNDLLLLAQADAGHLPISRQPVEVDAILAEIAHQTRVLAGDRITVELNCTDMEREEPLIVLGDADRLRQLFLNLVDNAIKHTPEGGNVSLCLLLEDDWVRLSVADTGAGISPQDLPYIFDRFYRAEKSRWRKPTTNHAGTGAGAGLGLSIARWIAEAHDGRIEVESQVGQGSVFHVWLPLDQEGRRTEDEGRK